MSYNFYIDNFDASFSITDLSEVPYITRNEDYTLIAEEIDFSVSSIYITSSIYPNNAEVKITKDGTPIYIGYINSSYFDAKDYKWKYTARHMLDRLNDYYVSEEQLSSSIEPYLERIDVCNNNAIGNEPLWKNNFINAKSLISATFASVGINVNWTYFVSPTFTALRGLIPTVETGLFGQFSEVYYRYIKVLSYSMGTVAESFNTFPDLYVWPHQLYCTGQKGIYSDHAGEINEDEEGNNNRITLFDLVSHLSSIAGISFAVSSSNGVYAINKAGLPTRSLNYEEDVEVEEVAESQNGCSISTLVPFHSMTDFSQGNDWIRWQEDGLGDRFKWNMLPFMQFPESYQFFPKDAYYGPSNSQYTRRYNLPLTTTNTSTFQNMKYNFENYDKRTWINHFVFYTFTYDTTEGTYLPNIILPKMIPTTATITYNMFKSIISAKKITDYENLVNTDKVTGVIENYININEANDGRTYSKIKIVEYGV